MSKSKYPLLSPMEAGYLVHVVDRESQGELTGGNWGRKDVRSNLIRLGLADYGEKTMIERPASGKPYEGHPLVPTDLGRSWVEWFHNGSDEPRNKSYDRGSWEAPLTSPA